MPAGWTNPFFGWRLDLAWSGLIPALEKNVAIGIIWQMTLVTIPLYMILRDMKGLWISIAILVVTTLILKKTWFERIEAA